MHRSFAVVRAILATAVTALLMSVIAAPATAQPLVSWRIINGIVKAGVGVDGFPGSGTLWTAVGGNATFNMGGQALQFSVIGLTLAEGDAIGTTGGVTEVRGGIGCKTGTSTAGAFTTAVTLNSQGDASFSGPFNIPRECTSSNIAFFITLPPPDGIHPGAYIAFGSSRFTH
jgi:hypothetical protein